MKKTFFAALSFLLFAQLSSSQDFNPSFSLNVPGDASAPEPAAPEPQTAAVKEWTLMFFMNGKNNLEALAVKDLNFLEAYGAGENLNIVAELGRMNGQSGDSAVEGNWTGMRRYLVQKDEDMNKIASPAIFSSEKYDMGDYRNVSNFVKWAKEHYPAKRYVLVLWNHGLGFLDPKVAAPPADSKSISSDDETGNYIRTKEIAKILEETGGVNVLAFNACLMQMAEALSELKKGANVVVGSEEVSFAPFFNLWAGEIEENPGISDEELGAVMVESYVAIYKAGLDSGTVLPHGVALSAIRTSKIDGLLRLVSDFAKLAAETGDLEALKKAKKGTLRFDLMPKEDPKKEISFYGDLYQFADLVGKNLEKTGEKAEALKAKIEELKKYISEELVIHKNHAGNDKLGRTLADANGISVYIPPLNPVLTQKKVESFFESPYAEFEFAKATGWHSLVSLMYKSEGR